MKKEKIVLWFFILLLPLVLYTGFRPSVPVTTVSPKAAPALKPPSTLAQLPSIPVQKTIQNWQTKQGAKVYFLQEKTLPMVDITISLDAGSSRDAEHPGLATLWLSLLDQGTTQLNADQIAEQFENTGALFNTNLNKDQAILQLRSLSDPKILSTVVDLLANILSAPAFSESSIASIKAQQLVRIQSKQQQPNIIAQDAFYTAIYGDHPYAHPDSGTEKTLATLDAQTLRAFHARYAVAKNSTITLVGDLEASQAKDLAEKLMQQLPEGTAAPALAAVSPLKASLEQHIDYASEQTHILMGAPCMAVNDPDYFALLLGNHILGANPLVSKLFVEVREKRGLAYNVRSSFSTLKELGPFIIKLQTKNTQTQEAIALVKETLTHFVKEGPSEEAVGEAKNGLVRAFPLSMNSNAKLSNALTTMAFYGLPLDFLDTYQQKIQSLTHTQVKAALQKYLDPDKMALIVVGPSNTPSSTMPSTPLKDGESNV